MAKLLTVDEAAQQIGVRPETIREWLRNGKLKGLKAGRLWRIRVEDLELFLDPTGNSSRSRASLDVLHVAEPKKPHI